MKTTLFAIGLVLGLIVAPLRAQDDASNKAAPVRIDHTGVHVGGDEPVDITLPNFGGSRGFGGIAGPLLPIISVLTVFGAPVAIIAFFLYFRHRRNRMLHETLRTMVEKGVPIPPELILGRGLPLAGGRGYADFRNGLILIGLGVGVLLLGKAAGFSRLGIIPLFIGIARIIAWLIGKRMKDNKTPQ